MLKECTVHQLFEATDAVFDYGLRDPRTPSRLEGDLLLELFGHAEYQVATSARILSGTVTKFDAVLVKVGGRTEVKFAGRARTIPFCAPTRFSMFIYIYICMHGLSRTCTLNTDTIC